MKIDYNMIPEHCREGMRRYLEEGKPTGSFLRAVLENNLCQAFSKADDINAARMRDYAAFLYKFAPTTAYGSPETVDAWIKIGGMKGIAAKTAGSRKNWNHQAVDGVR